jgi:hypothetical protein
MFAYSESNGKDLCPVGQTVRVGGVGDDMKGATRHEKAPGRRIDRALT